LLRGGLFEYRDLGSVALKGFVENLPAWQVMGLGAAESRLEALRVTTHALAEIELQPRSKCLILSVVEADRDEQKGCKSSATKNSRRTPARRMTSSARPLRKSLIKWSEYSEEGKS